MGVCLHWKKNEVLKKEKIDVLISNKHQRNPLDDWTRYGVRLPMFLGLGILLTTSSTIVLSFTGFVNSAAIPIAISLACIGVWLIVEAFFKVDSVKREEAAKYFQSKAIQNKWEEEMRQDKELLESSCKIPLEDILEEFNFLMQAVKQQCAISMINEELAKEGKQPVPDVVLPETFPKSTAKRKYSGNIPFNIENTLSSSPEKRFQKSSNVIFNSMPNIHAVEKVIQRNPIGDLTMSPNTFYCSGRITEGKIQNDEEFAKIRQSFRAISKPRIFRGRTYTSKTLSRLFPHKINNFPSLSTPNLCYERLSTEEAACKNIPSYQFLKDKLEIIDLKP